MIDEQEWWLKRRGCLSSTCMRQLMNNTARGWTGLIKRLNDELTWPEPRDFGDRPPRAIAWGKRYEPMALANYAFDRGYTLEYPGFVPHWSLPRCGATIDAIAVTLDGVRRGCEVKCPFDPENHRAVIRSRAIPEEYFAQAQAELWINKLSILDFISFDPREPEPELRLVVVEVYRDQKFISQMEAHAKRFIPLLMGAGAAPEPTDDSIPELF